MASQPCSLFASPTPEWPPAPHLRDLALIAREDARTQRHLTLEDLTPHGFAPEAAGALLVARAARFVALREALGRRLAAAFEYQGGRLLAEKVGASTLAELLEKIAGLGFEFELVTSDSETIVLDEFDCPTCRGLPNIGEAVCSLEAGLLSRGIELCLGRPVRVRETQCWAAGGDRCRFVAELGPEAIDGSPGIAFDTEAPEPLEMLAALAGTAGEAVRLADELNLKNQALEVMAATDPLTGIANRRALMARLRQEVERAGHYDAPLALAVIDIDDFKAVNDRYGHDAGDDVLVRTARALADNVRGTDQVARYGGEEFTVLCPGQTLDRAMVIVERIRETLASDTREPHVTISAGVAAIPPVRADLDELLNMADRALYVAKRSGKNRVVAAEA